MFTIPITLWLRSGDWKENTRLERSSDRIVEVKLEYSEVGYRMSTDHDILGTYRCLLVTLCGTLLT